MGFGADDELMQDFLVEAGELLDALGEQLLELERSPNDPELLNAIFRSFHTIKGGAGFLELTALVDVCHRAEDVFNQLRQGERAVDSELMDTMLVALDHLNAMFGTLRAGDTLEPADAGLMMRLDGLAQGEVAANNPSPAPVAEPEVPVESPAVPVVAQDPVDAEFDMLLDAARDGLQDAGGDKEKITDEEFETLLDDLHGAGKHGGVPASAQDAADAAAPAEISEQEYADLLVSIDETGVDAGVAASPAASAVTPAVAEKSAPAGDDKITEDEFEALLDQLHGTGKGPGAAETAAAKSVPAEQVPTGAAETQGKSEQSDKSKNTAGKKPASEKPSAEVHSIAERPAATAPAAAAPPAHETTVRVDVHRLDDIMNLVGELVLVRNRLMTLHANSKDEAVVSAMSSLELVTTDLQMAVMRTRMQPIKKVFGRFPRVVRDLARNLNKEIELELYGEETELDKNMVEALADPLIHLVRNAVDHGVEMPDERRKKGKPATGRVTLSASQQGDHILLSITDDGKGMDPVQLRKKAVEKRLMDEETAQRLSDTEAFDLIFQPGFSTKEQVSDVSGRGVGMDVVKTHISDLNGIIEIDSALDEGTTIRVRMPLTLAIVPTLMIRLANRPFAIPLSAISEILDLDVSQTKRVEQREVMVVRGGALPLVRLAEWLGIRGQARVETPQHVVVAMVGARKVGFVVDELLGQEEVVIKPLAAGLLNVPGYAGATITGDGKLALILDLAGLLRAHDMAA